jgi:hypothetical protein
MGRGAVNQQMNMRVYICAAGKGEGKEQGRSVQTAEIINFHIVHCKEEDVSYVIHL